MAELTREGPATEQDPVQPREGGRGLLRLAILVVILGAAFAAYRLTPLGDVLTREGVAALVATLRGSVWAPFLFVGIYAMATALAIPGTALTLLGGAVFGVRLGTLFNWLGANIGANIAFWMARALGKDGIQTILGDRAGAFDRTTRDHGFQGLLTLRLIPLVPFNALNFGSGLTGMSGRTYALATAIGILPGTAVYTFFADALLQGSQEASRDAWIRVLIAGLLLVALTLLPTVLKRFRKLPAGAAMLLALSIPGQGCSGEAARPADAEDVGSRARVGSVAAATALPDHAAFTRVLGTVVQNGLVDYQLLADERAGLDGYLATLAAVSESALADATADEVLAFWINAYNACMLKRVVDHYPIEGASGLLSRVRGAVAGYPDNSVQQIEDVFTGAHCAVAGRDRSQDEIEHEIIRPMGDPRIHFVINCAARSCPELSTVAYEATTLNTQLDEAVRTFMADPRHYRFEDGTLTLNKVLDWFGEDFGGAEGLRRFFSEYADGAVATTLASPSTDVRFFDYDWTLNDTGL